MNLVFDRGHTDFKQEEFVKIIQPFMKDLESHKRTNYLFVATFGDGTKPAVTGYRTDNTINVTINKFVLQSERTGGKWAVFRQEQIS